MPESRGGGGGGGSDGGVGNGGMGRGTRGCFKGFESSTPVGVRTVCNLISYALCLPFSLALDVNKLSIVFRQGPGGFSRKEASESRLCTAVV